MRNLFSNAARQILGLWFGGHLARHILDIPLLVNRPYLVKGLLLPKQISVLAAPPNTGKSCIVGALLAKLSQGHSFAGRRVKRSAVLYVGAEDPDGIASRADGHFATDEDKASGEFLILDRAIDMSQRVDAMRFVKDVKRYKKRITAKRLIIVFDTLTLSIGGADENSAGDMTEVMSHARELALSTEAHVLFVHHTSAADPKKARGSTALVGNPDTVLILKPFGKSRVLMETAKQRSMPKGDDVGWEIVAVDFGVDDDGDPVTNASASWVEDTSEWSEPEPSRSGKKSNFEKSKEVLRTLALLNANAVVDGASSIFGTKDIAAQVGSPFDRASMKPDSLQKAVRETLNGLVKAGRVEKVGAQGYRLASDSIGPETRDDDYVTLH